MSTNSIGGMTSLSSGPGSDVPPESLSVAKQGYDHVFVPMLGPSYVCPICLSVLREPRQTKCGHRFCRDCISLWMSKSNHRCPVDNEALSEAEIFPDNCIKREILSSPVKCQNHEEGCTELTTILQMHKHLEHCQLSLVPCPLNCPCVISRRDIEDHKLRHCENRQVTCSHCHEDMTACMLEVHNSNCPQETVHCTHCDLPVLRGDLEDHIENDCRNVMIQCPFHAFGCNESVLRDVEGAHLAADIPSHLKMLATTFNLVLEGFSSLAISLGQMKKQVVPAAAHSDDFTQTGISENGLAASNESRLGGSFSEMLRNQSPPHSSILRSSEGDSIHALTRSTDQISSSSYRFSLSGNEGNINNVNNNDQGVGGHHLYNSMPYSLGALLEKKEDASNVDNHTASSKPPLSSSQSVPILYRRCAGAAVETTTNVERGLRMDISQPNVAEFANNLQTVFSHQQQIIDRQQVIITNLCAKLASVETRFNHLEGDGSIGSAQNACGDFYWTISDFGAHRGKAMREETSILHSPAFYSSPWGYKLCLRVNVNGSLNSQGEHFVSLFIHFMQGTNDHLLNWPFMGQITLSIIDQNSVCKERKHATEMLRARPDIAAFQKPTSARNHKGFGYTEFISLNVLDNGNFVKDDTLIIRAQVFPSPP